MLYIHIFFLISAKQDKDRHRPATLVLNSDFRLSRAADGSVSDIHRLERPLWEVKKALTSELDVEEIRVHYIHYAALKPLEHEQQADYVKTIFQDFMATMHLMMSLKKKRVRYVLCLSTLGNNISLVWQSDVVSILIGHGQDPDRGLCHYNEETFQS